MSCPFYAHALFRLFQGRGNWVLMANERSNQCALVTHAHSPCIIESSPDWSKCPRNPANIDYPVGTKGLG